MKIALILLLFSTAATAQTFMCGSMVCGAGQTPTGIANLSVDGQIYNVTYSFTVESSAFVFSPFAAAVNQAPTAVDAANAINAFYGTQNQGYGNNGPGPRLLTAMEPSDTTFYGVPWGNGVNMITATPFFGYTPTAALAATQTGDTPIGFVSLNQENIQANPCGYVVCTVWTQAPELGSGWAATLTLLAGIFAVRRRA